MKMDKKTLISCTGAKNWALHTRLNKGIKWSKLNLTSFVTIGTNWGPDTDIFTTLQRYLTEIILMLSVMKL